MAQNMVILHMEGVFIQLLLSVCHMSHSGQVVLHMVVCMC